MWTLAAAVFSVSCSDDSTTPTPPPSGFKELNKREHVLTNFALAHNKRDSNHYDAVLDDNFTFYYTDPNGGAPMEVQWERIEDMVITSALFSGVDHLAFDVDASNVLWTEFPAPSGTEYWYSTTLFYHFTIKKGNYTYIPNAGAKMEFTVRNAGSTTMPKWTLVELRDLGGPTLLNATRSQATETTTYGLVKGLFRK